MRGTHLQGVVIKPGTGKSVLIPATPIKDFKLTLAKNVSWYMGIDQSTSCTGICFKAANNSFLVLLDVIRDKNIPKETYGQDLYHLLSRVVNDQIIDLAINEKPVPSKYKFAHDILVEFLGKLQVWLDTIPEFENALRDSIYPQSWKSLVMDQSKGKNRKNVKAEVAADLVDVYPELQEYYEYYHTSDYDSFEALGILDGFIKYAFTSDGCPMIHGIKEKSHISFVAYDWIDWDDSKEYDDNIKSALGDTLRVIEPNILSYNERYSLHDNIRMSSSNWDCTVTVLPQSELTSFMWKYSVDITEQGKRMIAIILRRGSYTSSFISGFKSWYPWNEEVFND